MTRFYVFDLHCGDKGPRDNFFVRGEDRFLRFLDFVDGQHGWLTVLGDFLDWWTTNLSRSVNAYKSLIERVRWTGPMGATWLIGNHDSALAEFLATSAWPIDKITIAPKMAKAYEETIGGKRFAFLHGHEADPYCHGLNPGIGEITAIISGLLEDRNKGPKFLDHPVEDEFVGTLEAALTLWRRLTAQHGRLDEMIDGVEAYRKEAGADVVVSGHTHAPGQIGDFHFNAGCWCRDIDTFVRIEDDGTTSLWQWDGTAATPFNKSLR